MEGLGKILVGAIAAIVGFVTVSLLNPFGGSEFDYASASLEDKQAYLERKARNMSRGFKVTAGNSSELSNIYVDAGDDLVSLTVKLKQPGTIPAKEIATARNLWLKAACKLTERKLLTESDFKLRVRYFQSNGANLMTVEANGDTCQPYIS